MIEDHGKCIRQLVEIVEMNVKSHLSQKMVDQFIVTNASQIIETREEIRAEVSALVVAGAEKILGSEIDQEKNAEIIEEISKEL